MNYFILAIDQSTSATKAMLFKEQCEVLILLFANDLQECRKEENMQKLEGKKMFLSLIQITQPTRP